MPILSFVHVYRQAVEGEDGGWQNLVRMFLPLTAHLLRQSFEDVWQDESAGAAEVFEYLRTNNAELLRAYSGTSEKAFLMNLRDDLFAYGRQKRGENAPLGMTHEQFSELMNEFAPVQREAFIMLAKGYTPAKFAVVLHMEDSSAQQVLQRANQKLESMGLAARLPAPMGSGFDRLLRNLESQDAGEDCLPVMTFVRIVDGQISWNDKESADRHLAQCQVCFQRYVTYLEIHWYYRDFPQAEDARVVKVTEMMGIATVDTLKKDSFVDRLLRPFKGSKSASA